MLAKRFFDGGSRNDLQTYLSFLEPDAEIDASRVQRRYAGIYRGREQIEALFRAMHDPRQSVHYVTANPLAVGDDVVIDVARSTTARRGDRGAWSALTAALTVREGRIAGFKVFPNRDEALEATGLAITDGSQLRPGRRGPSASRLPLTERERQVVSLIALGCDSGQIATELFISPETVRTHVRNAMSKLGARTRAQLVALVLCNERADHRDRAEVDGCADPKQRAACTLPLR
jgi:DNA-binding CsgD family transcriptional regulator/ketosteroid isomerase-like protein